MFYHAIFTLNFSDHLSPRNKELFEKAVDATDNDSVWFANRKVHAIISGKKRVIESECDLNPVGVSDDDYII